MTLGAHPAWFVLSFFLLIGGILVRLGTIRLGGALLVLAVLPATLPFVQARNAPPLQTVLTHLDDEAKDFHSLSADLERTKVTVVVNDHSTETGHIDVHDDKMLLIMNAPNERTILRTGDDLFIYTPGLRRVEQYDLGKNRTVVDQFLLLGFGTSGRELERGYEVALLDEASIDGRQTAQVELTPKSDGVRKQISKIQIWFDESTWLPIQQEFFESGSGDYSIVHYRNVVRNAKIPESTFKPHWPKNTEKIKPQG